MNQRRWRRFALAAPIMLAVIIGSGAVRAQAVDQATVEELKRNIAEQQSQIGQLQQLLQVQSIVLDGLQQQVVKVRKRKVRKRRVVRNRGVLRVGRRRLIKVHY